MNQVKILKRQHEDIQKIVKEILESVEAAIQDNNNQIALKINQLAGMVKIHLNSEDRYMYPNLMQSDNPNVNVTAKKFFDEMGQVNQIFQVYKEQYNTMTKIRSNFEEFKEATKATMGKLMERLEREDRQLYVLIK